MDLIEGTAGVWFDSAVRRGGWERERDVPRLRAAFDALVDTAIRWPAPAEFFAAMPRLPTPYHVAPAIDYDRGKREISPRVAAVIAELAEKLHVR
jgi:hypothetical protein